MSPYLPHEFASRQASFGLLDVSAQAVEGAGNDLDPIERARLRQFIERFNGDRALLELDDAQLDAARADDTHAGRLSAVVTGLLLIGNEASLRALVPLKSGLKARRSWFSRAPLLRPSSGGNLVQTAQYGQELVRLFRVPVPRLDQRAFREAIANFTQPCAVRCMRFPASR